MSLDKLLNESKTNYKVYTPLKISREIVASALSLYFKGNKKKKLLQLKACDLCCGNGNLLLVLMESLIRAHKIYFGFYDYKETWVEGYDLDKDALVEFESRAESLFKKYGLSANLRVNNINSLEINNKLYNIVLGNPPYMGEKNNRDIFDKIKCTEFGKKYYEGKMDYLYFFIEKGLELLEMEGVLSYITTNYWLRADNAVKLREAIKNNSSFHYVNNINKSVFKEAMGQHNVIFTISKRKIDEFTLIQNTQKYKVNNCRVFDSFNKIVLTNNEEFEFFELLMKKSTFTLGEMFNVNQGIVSGCDKAFVLDESKKQLKGYLKPFYKNKDIHKYRTDKSSKYILYLDGKLEPNNKVLDYLNSYREKLESRREVKKGVIKWWQLQWARDEKIFNNLKIISRQRNMKNSFALSNDDFYASADVYYISPKSKEVNIYYILAFLNSEIFYKWFLVNGKSKGNFLELYSTPLKKVPIIYTNDTVQLSYIENLVKKQIQSFDITVEKKINDYFYKKLNS